MRDGGLYYGNARTKPRIGVLEGGHEEGPVITIPTVLLGPSQASSGYRFSLEGFILLMSKVHYPQTLSFGYKKNVLLKKPPNTGNNGFSAIYFTSKGSFED